MSCDKPLCHACNDSPTKHHRRPLDNMTLSLYFTTFIAVTCFILFICIDYIKKTLVTMEESHSVLTIIMFLCFFIFVSFPFTWGYVLLNLAAGYLYGVINGVLVVSLCALVGISTSHLIIRRFMKHWAFMNIIMNNFRNLVVVVESDHGFKVVVLTRLTPIPFGLQNALFGMCRVGYKDYVMASMIGMLPTQTLHAYVGSTLRSMEDVVSNNNDNNIAYFIFAGQLLLVVALFMFVSSKARHILSKISLTQLQQHHQQQQHYQQQQQQHHYQQQQHQQQQHQQQQYHYQQQQQYQDLQNVIVDL